MVSIPKQILVATNNKGKFFEISYLLEDLDIEAVSAFQFDLKEPAETGKSFEENSLIKAKYYAKKTGLASLSDDSGLCVEALGGKPGIHSARFAIDDKSEGVCGDKKNFPLAFEKIFAQLNEAGVCSKETTKAYFICNLSFFDPKVGFSISFEGRVDGALTFPARGAKGFGYDPIFIKNGMAKTFGEISPAEKDKISHRAEAFKKFKSWLVNLS